MKFIIKEIKNDDSEIDNVKNFLYDQIKKEYGIGPNMEFHYDIESMNQYYIDPACNSFFIVYCEDKIVATAGLTIRILIFLREFILPMILQVSGG